MMNDMDKSRKLSVCGTFLCVLVRDGKEGKERSMENTAHAKPDRKLVLFFGITLLWTWICGFIPVVFGFADTGFGTFLFYFGGGAPSVTALLSSYTTEISAVIRYTNMFFFAVVIVYMCCSGKFRKEAEEQIDRIKTDEKRFLQGQFL